MAIAMRDVKRLARSCDALHVVANAVWQHQNTARMQNSHELYCICVVPTYLHYTHVAGLDSSRLMALSHLFGPLLFTGLVCADVQLKMLRPLTS